MQRRCLGSSKRFTYLHNRPVPYRQQIQSPAQPSADCFLSNCLPLLNSLPEETKKAERSFFVHHINDNHKSPTHTTGFVSSTDNSKLCLHRLLTAGHFQHFSNSCSYRFNSLVQAVDFIKCLTATSTDTAKSIVSAYLTCVDTPHTRFSITEKVQFQSSHKSPNPSAVATYREPPYVVHSKDHFKPPDRKRCFNRLKFHYLRILFASLLFCLRCYQRFPLLLLLINHNPHPSIIERKADRKNHCLNIFSGHLLIVAERETHGTSNATRF